jgi:outer membrane protein OmpA-like peptidoglycan-associated protein
MNNDRDDENKPLLWILLISVVTLAVGLAVGVGISKVRNMKPSSEAAAQEVATTQEASAAMNASASQLDASAPVQQASAAVVEATPVVTQTAPAIPVVQDNQSAVQVVDGVVKFYFASGKADLADGAQQALAEVVKAASQGKNLVLSGYHDSTGLPQANTILAQKRALAVKNTLKGMGVKESQMIVSQPTVIPKSAGPDAQARRVEVAIQ